MSTRQYPGNNSPIVLGLTFETDLQPLLRDITSILYGIELLHDFVTLSISEHHQEYEFNDRFFNRTGRPLQATELLHVTRLSLESPLTVDLIAVPLPALATALVVVNKIGFWRFDPGRVQSEIATIRRTVDRLDYSDKELLDKVDLACETEQASKIFRAIVGGMESIAVRIRLTDIAFRP